ncbi:MAG TPA: hypothetical protein VKX46_11970 [Ktedonobacteraceae bacterium]|nr:hypothetical protein [Ktedonobacteraceae bacterium]
MNNTDLPQLPPVGTSGSDVCSVIRLYLAVWDDLSPTQAQAVTDHLQSCQECTQERQRLQQATQLVASLAASEPSAHVDRAVLAAIAARHAHTHASAPRRASIHPIRRSRRATWGIGLLVAVAASIVLALVSSFLMAQQQAFALPAQLSWSPYVLYHTQTIMNPQGELYEVKSYHNMTSEDMNVELTMDGKLDVVVVKTSKQTLGLDMMHHVAQRDVHDWSSDDSLFELGVLRHDLQTHRASYEGKGQFRGQDVYRIRTADGHIMLLDMHYMPVNVLQMKNNTDAGTPVYDSLEWLPLNAVPRHMWQTQVPPDFTMGQLPPQP